jgi:hypothetical protein
LTKIININPQIVSSAVEFLLLLLHLNVENAAYSSYKYAKIMFDIFYKLSYGTW